MLDNGLEPLRDFSAALQKQCNRRYANPAKLVCPESDSNGRSLAYLLELSSCTGDSCESPVERGQYPLRKGECIILFAIRAILLYSVLKLYHLEEFSQRIKTLVDGAIVVTCPPLS